MYVFFKYFYKNINGILFFGRLEYKYMFLKYFIKYFFFNTSIWDTFVKKIFHPLCFENTFGFAILYFVFEILFYVDIWNPFL